MKQACIARSLVAPLALVGCVLIAPACDLDAVQPLPQTSTAQLPAQVPAAAAKTSAPASRAITVQDAWLRMMPPGSTTTAAFMTLHNDGHADTQLVGADTDLADSVELHTHVMEDGFAKMRQIDSIPLPVGADHKLQPAGDHLMLIGLHKDLVVGQEAILTLRFGDGSDQQLHLSVRPQAILNQPDAQP